MTTSMVGLTAGPLSGVAADGGFSGFLIASNS